jgi:3D (Asp-Asp-Asp) domain-containing protein
LRLLVVLLALSCLSFIGGTPHVATAYSLKGKTASGVYVKKGIIAADPKIHKLGTHVWINAGKYSGKYLVADTGRKIKGFRVDIWLPSTKEALLFGRRKVYVQKL